MEGLLNRRSRKGPGHAECARRSMVSKVGTIAGWSVIDGVMTRQNDGVRVLRDNVVIYTGKLHSLKRSKMTSARSRQDTSAASASRTSTTSRSETLLRHLLLRRPQQSSDPHAHVIGVCTIEMHIPESGSLKTTAFAEKSEGPHPEQIQRIRCGS